MSKKVAVLTDSNSGITQEQGKILGIPVLPMPFYINDKLFYEDITLTQEQFYRYLEEDAQIHTSMPVVGDVLDCWDRLLKEYDEIVYIPMSSGLSSSCATAQNLADDYDGRVQVVNNQRISVTQRQSVLDAIALAKQGWDAARIREYLEKTKFDSSIYISLPTLKYLKNGGRVTATAAAFGSSLFSRSRGRSWMLLPSAGRSRCQKRPCSRPSRMISANGSTARTIRDPSGFPALTPVPGMTRSKSGFPRSGRPILESRSSCSRCLCRSPATSDPARSQSPARRSFRRTLTRTPAGRMYNESKAPAGTPDVQGRAYAFYHNRERR